MAEPTPYYGHCCVRYRWINVASEGVPKQCEDDGYIIPDNITENVAHCLKYNDALRLGKPNYYFLTKDVSETCESDVNCQYVLYACEKDFCPPCPTMSPFASPTFTPTLMTNIPTPYPRTITKEPTVEDKIITAPPNPTPAPPTYQLCEEVSIESRWNIPTPVQTVDNRQPSMGLRAVISYTGPDPRYMTRPVTPFVGQIIWTLTDNTQTLEGWVDCDGSLFEPTGKMALLGELLGGNVLPNCNQRIMVGQTSDIPSGMTGGVNTLDISTLMPDSHIHDFEWTLSDGCNGTSMAERLSLTLSDVASHNTSTFIENRQAWLSVTYLIAAKRARFTDDPSRVSEDLMYGEIVMYAGKFIDEILSNDIFYPCDGSEKLTSDSPELAMVVGDKYDSDWHMAEPTFRLPDLSGRALVHTTTGAEFGDPSLCYFGQDNFTLHQNHLGPHHHGTLELHYDDSCTVEITVGDFHANSDDCEALGNVAKSVVVKYGAYHGSNVDPTYGHYVGAISLFPFNDLPSEYIGLDGYEVMSMTMAEGVSRKFIVDADRVRLPQMNGRVAMDVGHLVDIGQRFGKETLCNCEDLIGDHKHWIRSWCLSDSPTRYPSNQPTESPSSSPSTDPSQNPTRNPTDIPTSNPTNVPSNSPTQNPTDSPSDSPTQTPTGSPSMNPSNQPSSSPTDTPTDSPSNNPTRNPSDSPTGIPTKNPTSHPTDIPTISPTGSPTENPTDHPTDSPSESPTDSPSEYPTEMPSSFPTITPTEGPSQNPTINPTMDPTTNPSVNPTSNPTTYPTSDPTSEPSMNPTGFPTSNPTVNPTTDPTGSPTMQPTANPTSDPTVNPTQNPTQYPTGNPTEPPSQNPSEFPSLSPSDNPSEFPTLEPSANPSGWPTISPSLNPTFEPTPSPIYSLDCSSTMTGFCTSQSKPDVYSTDIDNMQAGVGVSMHIASQGVDPRSFDTITDESSLTTPFIGQLLLNLRTDVGVDKDIESTIWLNCDGETYESNNYPVLSEIINDGTYDDNNDFTLPDCRKRVLIGGSSIRYGGLNEFSINSNIFVKHTHQTSTQSTCSLMNNINDDIGVKVEGTIHDTSCDNKINIDRYDFDNRQSYLQVFIFVVARGKNPWSNSNDNETEYDDETNQLVIGEMIFSMYEINNEEYLIPCDGRSISVSDYPQLYSVIGLRYTSSSFHQLGYFNIPDCRGRTIRNLVTNDGSSSDSDDSMYSGEIITSVTSDNIAPHWHDPTMITFDQNPDIEDDDYNDTSSNDGSVQSTCDVWIFNRANLECTNLTNEMPSIFMSVMLYMGQDSDDYDSINSTDFPDVMDDITTTLDDSGSGQFDESDSSGTDDIFSEEWYQNSNRSGAGSFTTQPGRFTGALYVYAFEIEERHGDYLPLRGYSQEIDEDWCDESLNHVAITISSDDQTVYIPNFNSRTMVGADPTSEDGINVAEQHGSDIIDCTKYDVMYPHTHEISLDCIYPTTSPTMNPTDGPTQNPTQWPSGFPTHLPSLFPSIPPTLYPSWFPTISPSMNPSAEPTADPSDNPTELPTSNPTQYPTILPSDSPSADPTAYPTRSPNSDPTPDPSQNPSQTPSVSPSQFPTIPPTFTPTDAPTENPSENPTNNPSQSPSAFPTNPPSSEPTPTPTITPSVYPTESPIVAPTLIPTLTPTLRPTSEPLKSAKDRNFTNDPTKSPVAWDCTPIHVETESTLDENGNELEDTECELSNVQSSMNVYSVVATEGNDAETMLDDYGELRMPFIGQIILSSKEITEEGFVSCDGRSVSTNGIRQVPDCRDRLFVGLDLDDFSYNDVGRRGGSSMIDFSELVNPSSDDSTHTHDSSITYSDGCTNDPIIMKDNTDDSDGITVDNRQDYIAVNHLIVAQGGSDPRSALINSNTLITGEIVLSIFDYTPNGFLLCEGQFVSKNEYSDLYEIMGDAYTPNDQLNDDFFKLPDCRGRTLISYNNGGNNFDNKDKYFGSDEIELTNDHLSKHSHIKSSVDLDLACEVNLTIIGDSDTSFCSEESFDNRMRSMSIIISQYLGGFDNMADQLSVGRTTYSLVYQTFSVRGLNFESNSDTTDHALISYDSGSSVTEPFESFGTDEIGCSEIICDHQHSYTLQCADPTKNPSTDPSIPPTTTPSRRPSPVWTGLTSSPEVCSPIIDGGWSEWSEWTECRKIQFGDRVRLVRSKHRTCTNPSPECGGCDCKGDAFEVEDCAMEDKCMAKWEAWKDWSVCVISNATTDCSNIGSDNQNWDSSVSCQGWRMRSRVCVKYAGAKSGYNDECDCDCECNGEYKQVESCETNDCLSVSVSISDWALESTDWLLSMKDMIIHRGYQQSTQCVSVRPGDCYSMWIKLSDYQGSFYWRYKSTLLGYHKPSMDEASPFDRDEKAEIRHEMTDWLWKPMNQARSSSESMNDEWSVDYHRDSLSDYVEYQGCIPPF